uniref:Nuclear transcription factor Y subunit n=1 Tax=Chenopodium quinoa TaxID=63459 RepID=A0A803MSD6_CHEQI
MQKSGTNRQISSIGSMPWWVAAGSQDEMNSSNLNQIDWIGEHQKSEHIMNGASEKEKQGVFHFSFSAEDNKNSIKENNGRDHQINSFQQFPLPQQKNYVELGLGQPMVYANHPLDQCHGLYAVYGTQPAGRAMLPFSVATEDGPIYVNPKQYHGIMRRRKMRAKEGLKNRSTKDKEVSDCKSPNFSGSEVTSMYYSKDFDCFGINPGRPFAFHPLQNMEGNRQGSNWVTAVDGCCNLFKV